MLPGAPSRGTDWYCYGNGSNFAGYRLYYVTAWPLLPYWYAAGYSEAPGGRPAAGRWRCARRMPESEHAATVSTTKK
eukprot:410160-Rhodomonas_salina.1